MLTLGRLVLYAECGQCEFDSVVQNMSKCFAIVYNLEHRQYALNFISVERRFALWKIEHLQCKNICNV